MSDLMAAPRRLYNCHDQSPSFVRQEEGGGRSVFLVRHSRSIQPLISRREARAVRRSRPTQSIKKTADLLGDARPLLLLLLLSLFSALFLLLVFFSAFQWRLSKRRNKRNRRRREKIGREDRESIEGKRISTGMIYINRSSNSEEFISQLCENE